MPPPRVSSGATFSPAPPIRAGVVVEALLSLSALAASGAAAAVVFLLWNHTTGADVLREVRHELHVGPGRTAHLKVRPGYGDRARLRNVRLEYAAPGDGPEEDALSIAVTGGAEAFTDGEARPAGLDILHWIRLGDLERFGPRRAHHYPPSAEHETGRHVFVWAPETDFVGTAHLWLRNELDAGADEGGGEDAGDATGLDVKVRVAYVEHLTRLGMRRLGADRR